MNSYLKEMCIHKNINLIYHSKDIKHQNVNRHCIKYVRIWVFTDTYSPVSTILRKNRYSFYINFTHVLCSEIEVTPN